MFAGNVERFELPAGVNAIGIMMDNGVNQVGQEAGKALARRLFRLPQPPVIKMLVPDDPGTDWLDVYGGDGHE